MQVCWSLLFIFYARKQNMEGNNAREEMILKMLKKFWRHKIRKKKDATIWKETMNEEMWKDTIT